MTQEPAQPKPHRGRKTYTDENGQPVSYWPSPEVAQLREEFENFVLAYDGSSSGFIVVNMNDSLSTSGTTRTVGFQLRTSTGTEVLRNALIELAVFDDAQLSVPSVTATLGSASYGTIVGGTGSAALKVVTSNEGRFECVLTKVPRGTVYVAASPTFGSPPLDCSEVDQVSFV